MDTTAYANRRKAVVFPKNRDVLARMGENNKMARKRRVFTQKLISDRTGLSRLTIRKIEKRRPNGVYGPLCRGTGCTWLGR